jgi:hypothetical protein
MESRPYNIKAKGSTVLERKNQQEGGGKERVRWR